MSHTKISIAMVIMLLFAISLPAQATTVSPTRVFDTFNEVVVKDPADTDLDPYWWIIQNGDAGQYYAACGDASCTTALRKNGTTFARLQLQPDATPGDLIVSEISELRTGYSYGQGRWLPTPDHPIVATARVRFSANYQANGHGGAIGSAGFWLYNSYIDFIHQTLQPVTALGFSWCEAGAGGGELEGLRTMVMNTGASVYNKPARPAVNMSDWMTWTMKWSAGKNGKQEVRFWINDKPVGHVVLHEPLPALSITFWADNQFAQDPSNPFLIDFHNPSANQNFDIDYVEVRQE